MNSRLRLPWKMVLWGKVFFYPVMNLHCSNTISTLTHSARQCMENVTVPGCSIHISEILFASWPHLHRRGSSFFMYPLGQLSVLVPSIPDQVSAQAWKSANQKPPKPELNLISSQIRKAMPQNFQCCPAKLMRSEEKTAGLGWWKNRTAAFIGSSTTGIRPVTSYILGRTPFIFTERSGILQFQVIQTFYIDATICAQCTSRNAMNISSYYEHIAAMLPWAWRTHNRGAAWVCQIAPHVVSHSSARVIFH